MDYKYYIYRQNLAVSPFDKYDLTNYEYVCEITNNGQWSLNIERNADWFTVIRQEFSGDISVSGADYNVLIAIEGDTRQYAIVIHRKCKGKVYSAYTEFWKGFFSYFDFKVDMDRCMITFQPTVWDDYSSVFDQMEIEQNVIVADVYNTFYVDSPTYAFEDKLYAYEIAGHWGAGDIMTWTEHPDYPGSKFYGYTQEISYGYYWLGNDHYFVNEIYRREYLLNTGVNPGGNWIADPLLPGGELSPGVYKWVRPYLDINPPVKTAVYSTTYPGSGAVTVMTNTVGDITDCPGGLLLTSVLTLFAEICNLNFESDFFTDSPCPMGGATLSLTMIDHVTNLRGVEDVATKGMMKLKDLLAWIRDTFNAYWYIDSSGDFRIEHRRYFDWGLSYTYSHVIELNLSTAFPTEVLNMRRYEWERPELYRYEKLEMQWMYNTDWTDSKIEYQQNSIMTNAYKTKSVEWSSDITGMIDNEEDLPKKGWALLDIHIRSGQYYVRNTIGAYSGMSFPNARFAPANIYAAWWPYGRLLPQGYVNGTLTNFTTIEKLRQQEQLTFPQCCTTIDYNGIFRTPLGDGIIDKAEYEAKTGNLKVNLIYE